MNIVVKNGIKNTKGKNIEKLVHVTGEHCGKNHIKDCECRTLKFELTGVGINTIILLFRDKN